MNEDMKGKSIMEAAFAEAQRCVNMAAADSRSTVEAAALAYMRGYNARMREEQERLDEIEARQAMLESKLCEVLNRAKH